MKPPLTTEAPPTRRYEASNGDTRTFKASSGLKGALRVPADKSISHRSAIFSAFSEGEGRIRNYLDSADTCSTLSAMQALGARVEGFTANGVGPEVRIRGFGLRGAQPARLDCGNASTLLRLLSGLLAGQPGGMWTLDGDESNRQRPMQRIADPLRQMGGKVTTTNGCPPLAVEGAGLSGITYPLPVASAQVKSCLLLAGLLADGPTTIVEVNPARDHSEQMLGAIGAQIKTATGPDGLREVTVWPTESLEPCDLTVPGDVSSAAFFLAAAVLIPGSEVRLSGVGVNPTRTGLLSILERMGAVIEVVNVVNESGEPAAELVARHAALTATTVTADEVPAAIDELPLVALLGCFAEGETVVTGAEELRHKESDRIDAIVTGLQGLGADIEAADDGFVVRGRGLVGGQIDSLGDHRIAMVGALAGLVADDPVTVNNMSAAAVSYPTFERDLASLTR